jgi:cytochrome P450
MVDDWRFTRDASDPGFYDRRNRRVLAQLAAEAPVHHVDAEFTQPFWNVCRHDEIREVGKRVDRFTTEHGVHLNAAAFAVAGAAPAPTDARMPVALRPANVMSAADHRRVRGPINPHFRADAIAAIEADVRTIVDLVLDGAPTGEEIDVVPVIASRIPLLVTARLLGVDLARERDFARWADAVLTSFEPGAEADWEALADMVGFFTEEVRRRRSAPGSDMISALLGTSLDDEEVVMWCWLLLVAGIETTGNLIAGGLELVLGLPDRDQARLRDDASLVRPAVAEMLRVITPGRYIRRTATEDVELGGCEIRAGDAVVMNFTVANHDPLMFDDPLRFDIDRRPNETLAFSYGPHRCVGMAVARTQSVIAFERLLQRFPRIEQRGPAIYRPSLATAVVESLPVVLHAPRK